MPQEPRPRHPPSSLRSPLSDLGLLCGLCFIAPYDAIAPVEAATPIPLMRLGLWRSPESQHDEDHVATDGKQGPVSSTGPYPACPRPAGPGAGAGGVSVPLQSGARGVGLLGHWGTGSFKRCLVPASRWCRGWGTDQVRRGAVQCRAKRSSCRRIAPPPSRRAATPDLAVSWLRCCCKGGGSGLSLS